MATPDVLWLQVSDAWGEPAPEVTHCGEQVHEDDIEYVKAANLLALVRYHKAYEAVWGVDTEAWDELPLTTRQTLLGNLGRAEAALSDRVKRMLSEE